MEGFVGRREDGDIGSVVDGVKKVSRVDSTAQRREVSSRECVGCVLRNDQQAVDDVDDTASEVYVLIVVSRDMLMQKVVRTAVVTEELDRRPL